jgi:hypothetical protein
VKYEPVRIADIAVDRRTLRSLRLLFPWWSLLVLWRLRRDNKRATKSAKLLGETAAKVVLEAQEGAKVLRRLTVWLIALTAINTAFVIYSALK